MSHLLCISNISIVQLLTHIDQSEEVLVCGELVRPDVFFQLRGISTLQDEIKHVIRIGGERNADKEQHWVREEHFLSVVVIFVFSASIFEISPSSTRSDLHMKVGIKLPRWHGETPQSNFSSTRR